MGFISNNISATTFYGDGSNLTGILPYKVYRAKLTSQSIDWPGYGYLYNWYAVDDVRGLANPSGGTGLTAPNEWRVPSDTDWDVLTLFAGGSSVAGGKLKSTLTSTTYPFYGWLNNGGGTDDYNFGGLGCGRRSPSGTFDGLAQFGNWWSSTNISSFTASIFQLYNFASSLGIGQFDKPNGCSIRLVREATASELLLNDGDTSDTSALDPYTGNDGTEYVTVKIGTQIWLAQNLRETLYNNSDPIFNAASNIPFGGDGSNATWEAKGVAQEGAWTAYIVEGGNLVEYDPTIIETIYKTVLENTLGQEVNWQSISFGVNTIYRVQLASNRSWYPTHIKLTPGYDVSDYNDGISTLVQKNLIVRRAVTGENYIDFFPVKIDGNGTLTIESLNNYSDLLGSPDSSIYVEILEYQPSYYYNSFSGGIGVNNL